MEIVSELLVDNPLVTVVIPSYNRKNLIGRTIDSILKQKCEFFFELIIGDDYSTDGVRDVLLEYQKNNPETIRLIFHEENIGLGANWAYCVKASRGKYLANCDNDDFWHNENKLRLQVDYLNSHLDIGVCHTNYRKLKDGKIEERKIDTTRINEPLYSAVANIRNFECCNSSILYRKELIDKYVKIDDYIKNRFTIQDWNTWVILAHHTPFDCLEVSTTTVLIDNESITRNSDYERLSNRLLNQEGTTKYMHDLYPELILYSEQTYKQYISLVLLNLAVKKHDFQMAKKITADLKNLKYDGRKTLIAINCVVFQLFYFVKSVRKKIIHLYK
jgi:glycosyltransferase involved in cell wall biosynthesis